MVQTSAPYGLWVGLLALCAGCATHTEQCKHPATVVLKLRNAYHLNQDRAGLPRSVVVRVFQLEEPAAFQRSSFDRLWHVPSDKAGGGRLVALPGRYQTHTVLREPQARYLALAANFRERQGAGKWRAIVRLPTPSDPCEVPGHIAHEEVGVWLRDYSILLPEPVRTEYTFEPPPLDGLQELAPDPEANFSDSYGEYTPDAPSAPESDYLPSLSSGGQP